MAAVFGDSFVAGETSASLRTAGAVITFFLDSRTLAVACPRLTREQSAALAAAATAGGDVSMFAAQDAVVAGLPALPEVEHEEYERKEGEEEDGEEAVAWVQSEPLRDRKSKFVGFAGRVKTAGEARGLAAAVRQSGATHNVVAWRLQGGESERDDDGEGGAGDWLLEMLDREDWRGVAVVVISSSSVVTLRG